jgi:tellurium resistance protein TerD
MPISLSKGGNVSLAKVAPGLSKLMVGLGWNVRTTDGAAFDLDASAFLLGENGKIRSDADFIFYNQKKSTCGSVESMGDNKTGEGDGDDESVKLDLALVPANVAKISFTVTIHEAASRKQNFGMINKAYIRVLDAGSNAELIRYDLSEDYSTEAALIVGEMYRNGAEWKFKAVGQGFAGGLDSLAKEFGVNL